MSRSGKSQRVLFFGRGKSDNSTGNFIVSCNFIWQAQESQLYNGMWRGLLWSLEAASANCYCSFRQGKVRKVDFLKCVGAPFPSISPQGWYSEYVNLYIPTQTPEENYSDYLYHQVAAQFTCGLMSALVICKQKERVWSYMTLNILTETRCHETTKSETQSHVFIQNGICLGSLDMQLVWS